VGLLTHLTGLYLHRNSLTGTIPIEISSCRELAELRLDSNKLSTLRRHSRRNIKTQMVDFSQLVLQYAQWHDPFEPGKVNETPKYGHFS